VAAVTPLLAARLRDGLRGPAPPDDPAPEQGTVILDEELCLVAATPAARDWIGRLGLQPPSAAEPLPGVFYVVTTRVALARAKGIDPPPAARVRLRDASGRWVVVRAAPLLGTAGGYAVTLESARSQDLAPLLMRAWSLTAREQDVAQLVIDGLTSEDIARELFISAHTVRDHVKAIFTKTGVSRRQDLMAALAGLPPDPGRTDSGRLDGCCCARGRSQGSSQGGG
jgi:DNA-binding CsgD family transcriptional regulator